VKPARLVLLVLTGLLALVPWVLPHGAAAQEQDPVPLPLDPLAPVLAVVGPASSSVCGGFGVVGLLAPGTLGPLAPGVLSAVGPVFTLCGAIPGTPAEDRYTCELDQQGLTLIGSVTGLAGVPPAFDIRPIGQVLATLGAALDLLLPPAQVDAFLDQPSIVLQCVHGTAESLPPPTTVAPPAAIGDAPAPSPGLPDPMALPSAPAVVPGSQVTIPPVPVGVTTPLGRVPFSYAAVFALPFLALLAGAAVGRDLLSPLPLDRDAP
jgi:hypothetical protein